MYVLVRADLPLADQLVQAGHACLEAGREFAPPGPPCHLVMLSVPSRAALHAALARLALAGIRSTLFHEPDRDLGTTAACTEPVSGPHRRLFRRYPLWQAPAGGRGPPAYKRTPHRQANLG